MNLVESSLGRDRFNEIAEVPAAVGTRKKKKKKNDDGKLFTDLHTLENGGNRWDRHRGDRSERREAADCGSSGAKGKA